jgi:hypothetical protein
MLTRLVLPFACFFSFCSMMALGQQTPTAPASAVAQEFPVVFQQNIVAGKTQVGTKIQAKLRMATLVHGVVVPQGAVFSGEVLESVAKTNSAPSRLALRIDSCQWKTTTAMTRLYLTGWFYPAVLQGGPDLQYGPPQSDSKTWNGMGQYPSDSPAYRPFPNSVGSDKGPAVPQAESSSASSHRLRIKDVETDRNADGTLALVSTHSNIKLDKSTIYVLASSELLATPAKPASAK